MNTDDLSTISWLEGHTDDVGDLAFSLDGKRLASASSDGTVRLWDVATGDEVAVLRNELGPSQILRFSPEDGRLLTATRGEGRYGGEWRMQIWSTTEDAWLTRACQTLQRAPRYTPEHHETREICARYSVTLDEHAR